jgi:GTPase SAR1 family protein
MWDTNSAERFGKLYKSHYRNTHLAIIMYDITRYPFCYTVLTQRHDSFANVEEEAHDLRKYCEESEVVVALIGNKNDTEQKRMVTTKQGLALAMRLNIPLFFEISSKMSLESVCYAMNNSLKATWHRYTMKYTFKELNDRFSQYKWEDPFMLFKQMLVEKRSLQFYDVIILIKREL